MNDERDYPVLIPSSSGQQFRLYLCLDWDICVALGLNPFFIRAAIQTTAVLRGRVVGVVVLIPSSSGQQFRRDRAMMYTCGICGVLIPSSSGQQFRLSGGKTKKSPKAKVLIPSSSGQQFRHESTKIKASHINVLIPSSSGQQFRLDRNFFL